MLDHIRIFSRKKQYSHLRHNDRPIDLITALEEIGKVHLKVTISHEVAVKLDQFLKEKGLWKSHGFSMLIQYGLSEENEEELERLKLEMQSKRGRELWGEYCIMKFRAYEYFMENKAITMKLRFLLSENRLLKKKLENEGLQSYLSKNEWDSWNEAVIDNYYRKYVFVEEKRESDSHDREEHANNSHS